MAKIVKIKGIGSKNIRVVLDDGTTPLMAVPVDGNLEALIGKDFVAGTEVKTGSAKNKIEIFSINGNGFSGIIADDTGLITLKDIGSGELSTILGRGTKTFWREEILGKASPAIAELKDGEIPTVEASITLNALRDEAIKNGFTVSVVKADGSSAQILADPAGDKKAQKEAEAAKKEEAKKLKEAEKAKKKAEKEQAAAEAEAAKNASAQSEGEQAPAEEGQATAEMEDPLANV